MVSEVIAFLYITTVSLALDIATLGAVYSKTSFIYCGLYISSSSSLDGITVTIYANCEINGNNIVFTALNVACANAIVNLGAKLKLNCTPAINLVNGAKNIKNITVPITLNKT